jgi:uncharacterized protein (TIGR02594 family)
MSAIPAAYSYLNTIKDLPPIVSQALKLYGTLETKGNGNNPVILKWAKDLGIRDYNMDSIPWCGLFAATVVSRAGLDPVASPLWARNWAKFGTKAAVPSLGDILVFVRPGGGHVGIYVGESATTYHVLAGNQGDKVCIEEIVKARCVAVRRPPYETTIASIKPYQTDSSGHTSTNEA